MRIIVTDPERYSSNPPPGLPKITPEDLKEITKPRSFESDFNELKQDYPDYADMLIASIEGIDPHFLAMRRSFAAGAMQTYILFKRAAEARRFEEIAAQYDTPTAGDGGGGADPQPSI